MASLRREKQILYVEQRCRGRGNSKRTVRPPIHDEPDVHETRSALASDKQRVGIGRPAVGDLRTREPGCRCGGAFQWIAGLIIFLIPSRTSVGKRSHLKPEFTLGRHAKTTRLAGACVSGEEHQVIVIAEPFQSELIRIRERSRRRRSTSTP